MLEHFKHMDVKQKILLIGGGLLVLYFLFRSVMGKGTATSGGAVPATNANDVAQALGDQFTKAMEAQGATQAQNLQALAAAQDKQIKAITDTQAANQAAESKNIAALNDSTSKQIDAISHMFSGFQASTQHNIDVLGGSIAGIGDRLNAQASQSGQLMSEFLGSIARPTYIPPDPSPAPVSTKPANPVPSPSHDTGGVSNVVETGIDFHGYTPNADAAKNIEQRRQDYLKATHGGKYV